MRHLRPGIDRRFPITWGREPLTKQGSLLRWIVCRSTNHSVLMCGDCMATIELAPWKDWHS